MKSNNELNRRGEIMRDRCNDIVTGRENGMFTVKTSLILPRPQETVFTFFADASNLEKITPPWLRFEILTPLPIDMHAGILIEYRLRVHGIPIRWRSEITAWDPPFRFVDEQQRGPYKKWVHEHTFVKSGDGSEIRDFVKYNPPGGWLTNFLFVRYDVRRIFMYRTKKLHDFFS